MQASEPEKVTRRVAVILGPGGSGRNLLEVVLPLLGRGQAIEIQGVFLEEAELKHAAELPFVKELCRVTFSVREFNNDQFERVLALRMRTAQRALSVLAKRAGVAHSFQNVRGSAARLLMETASQSDITVFEPARTMAVAMASRPQQQRIQDRIVVAINEPETAGQALTAALHLVKGDTDRITVLLSREVASDPAELNRLFSKTLPAHPGRIRRVPEYGVQSLVEATRAENAAMLVVSATPELITREGMQDLRQRLRCPICLVRHWGNDG